MTIDLPVDAPFVRPEIRHEGRLKVTGEARYTADHHPAGMLYAATLGSPVPHARITSIDTSVAEALPGVVAVLTGRELGDVRFGRHLRDLPVLAGDRVLHIGQRVAAVAAETREAAEEAVRLIDVEYADLPPVFDPSAALADGAPVLHPGGAEYATNRGPRLPVPHPNVQGELLAGVEDDEVEAALAGADHVIEHVFRTPRQHQGFIEPHAALVWFEGETCYVVSTNKAPFTLRQHMAAVTGQPAESIVVHNRFIGGDFGGKGFSIDEYVCYYLAKATGRPVRSVMSYVEELSAAGPRHSAELRLRTGVTADGRFVAHAAEVVFDGGAFAAGKAAADLVPHGGLDTMSAYSVPTTRHRVRTVYTNSVPGGHMRAPGRGAGRLRRRDARRHDRRGAGPRPAGAAPAQPAAPRPPGARRHRGRDHGRRRGAEPGGRRRGLDGGPPARPGHGDRGVPAQGRRGEGRCRDPRRRPGPLRGDHRRSRPGQRHGHHDRRGSPPRRSAWTRAASRCARSRPPRRCSTPGAGASRVTRVLGEATRVAAERLRGLLDGAPEFPVEATGEAEAPRGEHSDAFGAVAVEVQVDEDTGQITVIRAALAADTGTVINPVAHRGQLEGGFAFGLGAALMEELPVEDGQVLAGSLGDYKLPTSPDMPPLTVINVGDAAGTGPFGAKAVGEFGNLGVAPAIGNAVGAAVGVRLRRLPLTAEAVWTALHGEPDEG